jgi:hypothetical protein
VGLRGKYYNRFALAVTIIFVYGAELMETSLTRLALITASLIALFPFSANASSIQLGIDGVARVGPDFINFGQFPLGFLFTPPPGGGSFELVWSIPECL